MRVFITTTDEGALEILKRGFTVLHAIGELEGVIVGERPLDVNDGFFGHVTLCVNLAAEVYSNHEIIETDQNDTAGVTERRTGQALVPADVLNQHGPVQVYDHFFAGMSRRELVVAARRWDEHGTPQAAREMRSAIAFFDEIGWLTPVRLQEELPRERQ